MYTNYSSAIDYENYNTTTQPGYPMHDYKLKFEFIVFCVTMTGYKNTNRQKNKPISFGSLPIDLYVDEIFEFLSLCELTVGTLTLSKNFALTKIY